jgi:uncharacterized membrane protein
MNKMLMAIFDNESVAHAGLQALLRLHTESDITHYASGVIGSDPMGVVCVKKSRGKDTIGTATGLALVSLIDLLGGSPGMVIGAMTGTMVERSAKLSQAWTLNQDARTA